MLLASFQLQPESFPFPLRNHRVRQSFFHRCTLFSHSGSCAVLTQDPFHQDRKKKTTLLLLLSTAARAELCPVGFTPSESIDEQGVYCKRLAWKHPVAIQCLPLQQLLTILMQARLPRHWIWQWQSRPAHGTSTSRAQGASSSTVRIRIRMTRRGSYRRRATLQDRTGSLRYSWRIGMDFKVLPGTARKGNKLPGHSTVL